MANIITFDVEESGGIMQMPSFSVFYYDPKEHPWESFKDRELGELIQIMAHVEDGAYKYIGCGLLESIKVSTFRGLDDIELRRAFPKTKSRLDLVKRYREEYPEYRADITADTQVGVLTIRPLNYKLKELNEMVTTSHRMSGLRSK